MPAAAGIPIRLKRNVHTPERARISPIIRENSLTDAEPRYTFTCPNCSGNFSIPLDRIPPVQARFRCPHCKQPMDFPSREEARVYVRLQGSRAAAGSGENESSRGSRLDSSPPSDPLTSEGPLDFSGGPGSPLNPLAGEAPAARFRVAKPGFEQDIFDRRSIRNLIRTGDILEYDRLRVDDGELVEAGKLSYLKSLFNLRKSSTAKPPQCCRTHTDKVAFFQCQDTRRPLCEDCAQEKKFGGTTLRVCDHCGGIAIGHVENAPA